MGGMELRQYDIISACDLVRLRCTFNGMCVATKQYFIPVPCASVVPLLRGYICEYMRLKYSALKETDLVKLVILAPAACRGRRVSSLRHRAFRALGCRAHNQREQAHWKPSCHGQRCGEVTPGANSRRAETGSDQTRRSGRQGPRHHRYCVQYVDCRHAG